MPSRAMIVVAAGSGIRFEGEKILAPVKGRPLVSHTISSVIDSVDRCVVVCRHDQIRSMEALGFDCDFVPGGPTRTASEMAGLASLGSDFELIGIHDGARPAVERDLIELLFDRAQRVGGAVPALTPRGAIIERAHGKALTNVRTVQTPQVFRGPELIAAYVLAARQGATGHDTVDIMMRFSDTSIAAVPGDEANIKVTFPEDLERFVKLVEDRSHSGPR